MKYTEFKLSVPIWCLTTDDDQDVKELSDLYELLNADGIGEPLGVKYDSYTDHSRSGYPADPRQRIGRGNVVKVLSNDDAEAFVAFDLFAEPTDQMDMIEILIRVPNASAEKIEQILRQVRSAAEVASALLRGNLGVGENLDPAHFPKQFEGYQQRLEVYRHAQTIPLPRNP